jgi:hypothetical protein
VEVRQGRVRLSGPILADEADRVMSEVSRVRGVRFVENRLRIYESEAGIPSLQSDYKHPRRGQGNPLPVNTPTSRLLTSSAGGALALYGLGLRNRTGIGIAGLGAALLGVSVLGATQRGRNLF